MTMKKQPLILTLSGILILASYALAPPVFGDIIAPIGGAAVSGSITGDVTVVNPDTRLMTIKTPDGSYEVLRVPSAVQGLEDVDIGDKVTISSYESLLVDLQKGAEAGSVGASAQHSVEPVAGKEPAAIVTDRVTLYGKVLKVDKENSTVTVQGTDQTLTLSVEDRSLLADLTPGDGIIATYVRVVTGRIES